MSEIFIVAYDPADEDGSIAPACAFTDLQQAEAHAEAIGGSACVIPLPLFTGGATPLRLTRFNGFQILSTLPDSGPLELTVTPRDVWEYDDRPELVHVSGSGQVRIVNSYAESSERAEELIRERVAELAHEAESRS